jgi:chromosome segregation ATPase
MKRLKQTDGAYRELNKTTELETAGVDKLEGDIKAATKRAAQRAARLAKLEREVEDAKAELAKVPASANRGAELEDIKGRVRAETSELRRLEAEVADVQAAQRVPQKDAEQAALKMRALDDLRARRIEALRVKGTANRDLPAAVEAVARLRASKRFQHDVYGPLICEVAVNDQQHAAYLEQHCAGWVWGTFVTTCDADRDLLLAETKGLKVSCMNVSGALTSAAPPVPVASLASLGVTATLHDLYEAPPAVKQALNDNFGLHAAYVGGSEADKNADAILRGPVRILWTPSNQYTQSGSRYSATAKSTRMVPTRPGRLFTSNANPAERTVLQARRVRTQPRGALCV